MSQSIFIDFKIQLKNTLPFKCYVSNKLGKLLTYDKDNNLIFLCYYDVNENDAIVIYLIKTGVLYRRLGICKMFINYLKSLNVKVYIFQVVSDNLNNLCINFNLKGCMLDYPRDGISTRCNYYKKDYGDYEVN